MHIVIFRALKLGDLLCTVPAFRALRKAFSQARISLMGLPWSATFVERYYCYIDDFIHFPGYPGLPEQPVHIDAINSFFYDMKKSHIDLLLQMQGNGSIVNDMLEQLHPRCLAGFCEAGDKRSGTRNFLEYPEKIHEIQKHLALLQHLHIPHDGIHIDFPFTDADEKELEKLDINLDKPYICIHPGSALITRQWPPELFARIAAHFMDKGFTILLTGGPQEKALTGTINHVLRGRAIDIAGHTTLGSLALILRHASGLISNCTGVSHLGAATKTKSVVISMDGEPHRWGPLDTSRHATIDWLKHDSYDSVLATASQLIS
ncbi:glycosyltransferase family 9 protein [Niabella yanshanensis]|uniref:Glycosyltransferase family 9 protein n=1 Tax=Niabella yanshanensis TaxID=577386 RepID=A0ABZ0W7D1_9BACT|nr:glycosyltransferase family 9 protein [Niabella yanshanensis]WQD38397.1 glycosyltransferase family 9 protein [Niabella yanshanensis]